jgi:hypothetical protein
MKRALLFAALCAGAIVVAASPQASAQRSAIEVEVQTEFSPWSIGSISSTTGGLPRSLWAESDPDTLALLFDRVPGDFASPAARALARRALSSAGEAPTGDSLLASRRRFEALGRMGATTDLLIMARPAAVAGDAIIAQYAAQAELAQGNLAGACGRAAAAGSGFLLRLRAFCAAVEGNVGAVDLALSLSRESGEARDTWYEQALGLLGGVNPPRAIAARYDTTLNTWASLAAGLAPGRNPLAQSSTLALLTLAGEDRTDPRLRAEAGLLALARGAVEPGAVRTLYRAVLAAGDARNTPALSLAIAQADALPGGIEAAAAAHAALAGARSPSEFAAIARILREDLMQLREVPGAAEGLVLARAALAAGDSGTGLRLIELAQGLGAQQSSYGSLRAAAWAASPRLTDEVALRTVRQRIDDGAGDGRAMRDVVILQALGFPLDNTIRRAQLARAPEGGRPADAAVLAALMGASDAGSVGETALLAAIACAQGPAQLDAHSLWTILVSLRLVGLEDEAQALAAEALLGA